MIESRNDVIKSLAKRYDCDPSVFKMLQLKNEEYNKSAIPEIPGVIFTCLELEDK